jgi:hypothetical protein
VTPVTSREARGDAHFGRTVRVIDAIEDTLLAYGQRVPDLAMDDLCA